MSAEHSIIVIGASAGGVEALRQLLGRMPRDIPAAMFITVHFPADAESVLPRILNRISDLPVHAAGDRQSIDAGHVYVAPPDRHLIITPGVMRLARGPTENGNRPAIDPMFRSAAVAYGRRVIGIVLTGNLDDGTAGLLAIKRRGGIAVAQDPADAMFPSMPTSAVQHLDVDYVVPLEEMPALLQRLATEAVTAKVEVPPTDDARRESDYSAFDLEAIEQPQEHPGEPSTFSCPDCGGVLWQIRDGDLARYRCRVGHGWTSDGLVSEQETMLDTALWTALRALEESANLNEQLAKRVAVRGNTTLHERFQGKARVARDRAGVVRQLLLHGREPGEGQRTSPAERDVVKESEEPSTDRAAVGTDEPSRRDAKIRRRG